METLKYAKGKEHYKELCDAAIPPWAAAVDSVMTLRRIPKRLAVIQYRTDKTDALIGRDGNPRNVRAGWYVADPDHEDVIPESYGVIINARPFRTSREAEVFANLCLEHGLP